MKLIDGVGNSKSGACWMSALNWYAYSDKGNFAWHDHPDCVDPVIRRLCILVNDALPTDAARERVIGPILFLPVGTNVSQELTKQRMYRVVDKGVREWAPDALEKRGHKDLADKLRTLAPIVDRETALAAREVAREVRAAAYAAAYAAADADAAADVYADVYADAAAYAATAACTGADAAADADAAEHKLVPLILELCEMGRTEIKACKTEAQVIEALECGKF